MKLQHTKVIALDALEQLYNSVGWTRYTEDMTFLAAAIASSDHVVMAWDGDRLAGLARCVSDDVSIVYLQEMLVDPDYQKQGLGRALTEDCLERYAHVPRKVLMTDDRPGQLAFYREMGFTNTRDLQETPLNVFVMMSDRELR